MGVVMKKGLVVLAIVVGLSGCGFFLHAAEEEEAKEQTKYMIFVQVTDDGAEIQVLDGTEWKTHRVSAHRPPYTFLLTENAAVSVDPPGPVLSLN